MNTPQEKANITILMATYNGEQFIEEQVDSIRQQTEVNWQLIIRDDNSSDHTRAILKKLSQQDPRIYLLADHSHKGLINNFGALLDYARQHTQSTYYALADQDDIWLPEKLSTLIDKMDLQQPGMVFSDLIVSDQDGQTLHSSFMELTDFDPNTSMLFEELCWKNVAPGCACLFNNKLLAILKPLPDAKYLIMHDGYLVQIAASCGKLTYVDTPLILYRQHGHNETGANIAKHTRNNQLARNRKYKKIRHKTIAQLLALKTQYITIMNPKAQNYLKQKTTWSHIFFLRCLRKWQSMTRQY